MREDSHLYIVLVLLVDMKKAVWENKSNGQLCVTIPKGSGIKAGDVVAIEKDKIQKIVYTTVAADLFHYGQLRFLEKADTLGDYHICGVLTDSAMGEYNKRALANFMERKSIISSLRCVDSVIPQNTLDPTRNLEVIQERFKDAQIIVVRGSNTKEIPGEQYIKNIQWTVVRLPYYHKLSDKNITASMRRMEHAIGVR